jgi:hypothetical protein
MHPTAELRGQGAEVERVADGASESGIARPCRRCPAGTHQTSVASRHRVEAAANVLRLRRDRALAQVRMIRGLDASPRRPPPGRRLRPPVCPGD